MQYFLVVLGLLLCECAAGVVAAIWPRCYGIQSARGGAVGALQSYYAVPDFEHFTAAVDLAQTEVSANTSYITIFFTSKTNFPFGNWCSSSCL